MIKSFDEVFEDVTKLGVKIKTDEYHPIGKYQIIDQGQEAVAGYSDLEDGVFENVPAIVFGDHTRIVKYVDQPFFLGADGVKVLRSRFKDANYRYLYYALKSVKIPNTGYNRHFKWLKEAKIYYPNSEEQSKIVLILDGISSVIEHRQRQLQKLNELVKARFVEMFGDPLKNDKSFSTVLGEVLFKLSNGKALPNNKRFTVGVPAYGGNGVSWYTDEILCDYDTIIIGRVGFQSGNVHLAKAPLWVTDNAMYISGINNKECDIRFLCSLMEHLDFKQYQDAGDLKKITQKPFMQMHYLLPPISLQKQYIAFVEQTDKSKVAVQKALDEAQLLFDSLMQKYFGDGN